MLIESISTLSFCLPVCLSVSLSTLLSPQVISKLVRIIQYEVLGLEGENGEGGFEGIFLAYPIT